MPQAADVRPINLGYMSLHEVLETLGYTSTASPIPGKRDILRRGELALRANAKEAFDWLQQRHERLTLRHVFRCGDETREVFTPNHTGSQITLYNKHWGQRCTLDGRREWICEHVECVDMPPYKPSPQRSIGSLA